MKTPQEILNQLSKLADAVVEPMGLAIVDVCFGQQGRRRSVQVTIFRNSGAIALSDCENVSRALETLLDKIAEAGNPLIDGPYVLEVLSPGIDRELKTEKEFRLFCGRPVKVKTRNNINSLGHLGNMFSGILEGFENGTIKIANTRTQDSKGNKKAHVADHHKHKGQIHRKPLEAQMEAQTNPVAQPAEVLIDLENIVYIRLDAGRL